MKIKSLKKKISSDTFSEAYPIGADAVNVDLKKGTNVEEEIISINSSIENINNSITSLTNNKLSKADVVNNLTTADASKALSANQGKALNEAKLNKSDVVNNVITTDASKALSAAQGKALSDSISALNSSVSQQINELNSNLTSKNVLVEIDTSVVTFNNVVARCSGNNVVISGNIRTEYKGTNSQFVFIRDPAYYPKYIVPFGINTSDGFVSTAYIETNGILKFNTASMNGEHDIYFNVSYII